MVEIKTPEDIHTLSITIGILAAVNFDFAVFMNGIVDPNRMPWLLLISAILGVRAWCVVQLIWWVGRESTRRVIASE